MRSHLHESGWKITVPLLAAFVLALLGTMAAIAEQDAVKSKESRVADPKVTDMKVNVAGMQVSIDPRTGKLRPPTAEESRELARALRQQFAVPSRPLQVIQAANGALAMELPEDFMETVVLQTHPDGMQTLDCMSAEEAARIIEGSSALTLPGLGEHKRATPVRPSPPQRQAEKE